MNTKIYLAPMSGVTDLSFRIISRKFGVEMCFFEMLDAKAMMYDNPANKRLMKTIKSDTPIAAQLLGQDPSVMLEAALKLLDNIKITFLDVNSACPARKVIKKGAGAALLVHPPTLGNIIKKLSSNLKIPVTVKLRTGYNKKDVKECTKTAQICQDNGAAKIFIHGRTRLQGYSGDVDYESIKAVKNALQIPVFASGNIFNHILAKRMIDETGCDGLLVARGAMGNPWIFKNIENYLKTGRAPKEPALPVKIKILKEHLGYIEKYKDIARINKIGFMGKVTMWYLKGLPGAKRIREEICGTKSYKELIKLIDRAGNLP